MNSSGFRENEPASGPRVWLRRSFVASSLAGIRVVPRPSQGPGLPESFREEKSKPLSKTTQRQVKKSKGAERSKSATRKSKTAL